MNNQDKGFVIINIGHPATGKKFIVMNSFRYSKKDAISNFMRDSEYSWKYWRDKFNFRCVRATLSIQLEKDI